MSDDNRNFAGAEDRPAAQQQAAARAAEQFDEALQRELDEALGGMSLEQIIDADAAAAKGAVVGGGIRAGKIIAIHGEDVFVDLGGRTQGVLSITQFSEQPKEGDAVQVTIEGYDESEGLMLLSREGAIQAAAWETLHEGQIVEGRVTGVNKGGLELNVDGIRAFMPLSHVALYRVDDREVTQLLNQRLRCQVVEVSREETKLVVSRRAVLELEAAEQREKRFESLVEGQTVTGTVKTIMPYGAFVDIGGVDGLLHVKDMSHGRVEDPHTVVQEGQKLELMVLKVDREARKVGLGLKQVMPDPWADVESKYPPESIQTGKVTRLADFGAFVELETGVEGLVPMSEMSFRRVGKASEIVNPGDVVKVRVLSVDPQRKRISLSVKRLGEDPWTGASVRWPKGGVVTGIVKRITDFGAFVEIVPGVEGLAHISELSFDRVRSVSDAVREGQSVQAKVLEVDEERRRISLSIKQAAVETQVAEVEAPRPQPKRKKPLKGGLD